MKKIFRIAAILAISGTVPAAAGAQTFESVGTRASGMGGAFVAVADDASAAYWNPAGFAAGSYFSLVLDGGTSETRPEGAGIGGSGSNWLLALGAPVIGLTYYRLRSTSVAEVPTGSTADSRNPPVTGALRLSNLVTHYTGATLVQSIVGGVAVGTTLKLVRGNAAAMTRPGGDRDALIDQADEMVGKSTNKFDADIGVMATFGRMKAGLTIRNVSEPAFETAGDAGTIRLERQARAGVSLMAQSGLLVAADLDLTTTAGVTESVRDLSFGGEGHLAKRAVLRGGVRMNTAGASGLSPSVSAGGSYAVTASLFVDAQITGGSDRAAHGWGVSGRLVY